MLRRRELGPAASTGRVAIPNASGKQRARGQRVRRGAQRQETRRRRSAHPNRFDRAVAWFLVLAAVGVVLAILVAVVAGGVFLATDEGPRSWFKGTARQVTSGAGAATEQAASGLGDARQWVGSEYRQAADRATERRAETTPSSMTKDTSTGSPVGRAERAQEAKRAMAAAGAVRAEAAISEIERETHRGINAARVAHGQTPLVWSGDLAAVARAHSEDMASRGYFDHDTPEGLDPTGRLHKAGFLCKGRPGYGIGENIAIESNLDSPEVTGRDAAFGWMGSAGHRRNILRSRYDETGIGAAFGTWQGRRVVYLTQVFC